MMRLAYAGLRDRLRHKQRDREQAMNKWVRGAVAALAMLAVSDVACAQSIPTKPVRLLVPYPSGGAVDVLARTLGDVVSKTWGQPVVVEKCRGPGGVIATQALVAQPPDGQTLIAV